MLPAEFELLLKVLQAPDDDEPRLVYADVLQERGDDRGEFIPLQCALAKSSTRSDPVRFAAMRAREGELLSEHGPAWLKNAAPFSAVGYFHRGFVEELQCLPGELLHRGLEVVAPIRVLRLDGDAPAEVAQRVMALPLATRVSELSLCLVDGPVDRGLRHAGRALTAVRQISAEPGTVPLLDQLGWLDRLERLELPMAGHISSVFDDLGAVRPQNLKRLWLRRQVDGFGRDVTGAIERLWVALPALVIRWRGIDYGAADVPALLQALDPYRVQVGRLAALPAAPGATVNVEVEEVLPPPRPVPMDLVMTDPPEAPAFPAAMELIPLPKPPPSTEPWARVLAAEGLVSRGFLPRAVPQSITVLRAEEKGVPLLVALGPAGSFGAVPFAQDIARLMSMPRAPDLLHVERTAMLEHARWAVFEPFEGVTLWELMRLHPRLSPGAALLLLGQTARAAARIDAWQASRDDVLIDLHGQVRLLPGFPGSLKAEEPSYTGREERHPLGAPVEDESTPGGRVVQLGTALFELLTGTSLFDVSGRSMLVLAADWYQLNRQLDRGGLSLAEVDPGLTEFEPLLARALSHAFGERYAALPQLADALLSHPRVGTKEELAQLVRAAVTQIPRTKDGR